MDHHKTKHGNLKAEWNTIPTTGELVTSGFMLTARAMKAYAEEADGFIDTLNRLEKK